MADDLSVLKIPLWTNVGLFGAAAVVFSIWKTLRITAWKLGVPLKDHVSQSMLYSGLAVCFINVVTSLAVLLIGSLRYIRFDNIIVSYAQWVGWALTFAILGEMMAKFLFMNAEWIKSLYWTFLVSGVFVVICSLLSEQARYLFFAAHAAVFAYAIHALWVYRERSDFNALFILCIVNVVWIVGFTLPFLLGHAALGILTLQVEFWWYVVASWIGQLFVPFWLCKKLLEHGAELTDWIDKRHLRIFTTRATETGFAGSYLAYLPTTRDKSAQAEALESGQGKRQPNALVVRTDADLGETDRDTMESTYEEDVYIRSEMGGRSSKNAQAPNGRAGSSAGGMPHLREIAAGSSGVVGLHAGDKRQ